MIFVKIGNHDYVNVEQIARCEFVTNNNRYQGNIYLAKPGGSDRHFVYDQAAYDLENLLVSLAPEKVKKKK